MIGWSIKMFLNLHCDTIVLCVHLQQISIYLRFQRLYYIFKIRVLVSRWWFTIFKNTYSVEFSNIWSQIAFEYLWRFEFFFSKILLGTKLAKVLIITDLFEQEPLLSPWEERIEAFPLRAPFIIL